MVSAAFLRLSWLVLVVPGGNIVFARSISLRQDGIDFVQTTTRNAGANEPRLELNLTRIGQVHLPERPKDTIFIDCVNATHGRKSSEPYRLPARAQQCLYFLPLPQGQGELRPTRSWRLRIGSGL